MSEVSVFSSKTDGYSNCDATIYRGICVTNKNFNLLKILHHIVYTYVLLNVLIPKNKKCFTKYF